MIRRSCGVGLRNPQLQPFAVSASAVSSLPVPAMPLPALLSRRRRLAVWGGRKGRTRDSAYNCGPATPEGGAEAAVWHGLCALSLSLS